MVLRRVEMKSMALRVVKSNATGQVECKRLVRCHATDCSIALFSMVPRPNWRFGCLPCIKAVFGTFLERFISLEEYYV